MFRENDRISPRGVARIAIGKRDVDRAPLAEGFGVDRVAAGNLDGTAGGSGPATHGGATRTFGGREISYVA